MLTINDKTMSDLSVISRLEVIPRCHFESRQKIAEIEKQSESIKLTSLKTYMNVELKLGGFFHASVTLCV